MKNSFSHFYRLELQIKKKGGPIHIIELLNIAYDQFKGPPMLIASLRVLRASTLRELMSDKVWDEELFAQLSKENLTAIFNYIYNNPHVDKNEFLTRIKHIRNTVAEEKIMTFTEYLEKKGRKEGQIQMFLTLLRRKFGELNHLQKERVQNATPRELKRWSLRIFDAESIESLLGV